MSDLLVLPDSARSSPPDKLSSVMRVQEIARRARAKWSQRFPPWDRQLQDWLEAETELALEEAVTGRIAEAKERIACLLVEQRESERRLVAEHAVSRILTEAETITDAVPKLVQAIGECFDWDVGAGWLLDRDANLLRCVGFWNAPSAEVPAFERDTRLRTFSSGIGMPGRVWASGSLVWISDITPESNFPRASIATEAGLHGAIAFPVHKGDEFIGILEFFSREVREPDHHIKEMMTNISCQISQFIEHRVAEKQLITQKHERLIGQQIQQGLLPKNTPRLSGFEIRGKSLAPNIVGGDCFDFIPMPSVGRDSIGVLVADASGHGIGAAILTVQTRAYLRGAALTGTDVGVLLDLTNQCHCIDVLSDHFVTAFLMRLVPGTRSLDYASAGHLPGYVLDPQGRIRVMLHSTGLPLGIDPASTCPSSTVPLEPGDLVLLVTDGITEAAPLDGELFGMERTLRLVRHHQHQTPEEILTELFAAVNDYCNNNCLDDLTAVIIKVDNAA